MKAELINISPEGKHLVIKTTGHGGEIVYLSPVFPTIEYEQRPAYNEELLQDLVDRINHGLKLSKIK